MERHKPWNPNEQLSHVLKFGALVNFVMQAGNLYTKEQIINRVKVNIINTGRYHDELKEYDDEFDDHSSEEWSTFKQIWLAAYNKRGKHNKQTKLEDTIEHTTPWAPMMSQQPLLTLALAIVIVISPYATL